MEIGVQYVLRFGTLGERVLKSEMHLQNASNFYIVSFGGFSRKHKEEHQL